MTPALYKTPSLLWLITVPIMMVMRMVRIKLDLIGKYVPCICLDSHDDLSLEWIGCIHRWPHLSHRGKSEKIIANHCWSHRITANLPNLVTYPLALEQTNIFVMHGLITVDDASKMNSVDMTIDHGTFKGWIEKQKACFVTAAHSPSPCLASSCQWCVVTLNITSSKWQFTNYK